MFKFVYSGVRVGKSDKCIVFRQSRYNTFAKPFSSIKENENTSSTEKSATDLNITNLHQSITRAVFSKQGMHTNLSDLFIFDRKFQISY